MFPVLIPQDMTPGSITLESLGTQTGENAGLEGLRVRTADVEIDLYFDARYRLMRLEVPAAKVVVTRPPVRSKTKKEASRVARGGFLYL